MHTCPYYACTGPSLASYLGARAAAQKLQDLPSSFYIYIYIYLFIFAGFSWGVESGMKYAPSILQGKQGALV